MIADPVYAAWPRADAIVSADWLAARLDQDRLKVLDCAWYLPTMDRDPEAEYRAAHIPGAVRFDIDAIAAPGDLPHQLPAPDAFAAAVGALGIGDEDTVIVYDTGLPVAPRVWLMFRAMGHGAVAVLDGGLDAWRAAGHAVEAGPVTSQAASFLPDPALAPTVDAEAVAAGDAQILDVRPADRFAGAVSEPRPGVRSGHIPGAANIPFSAFYQDGFLKPQTALADLFAQAGLDIAGPTVSYCGSGVTAAIPYWALYLMGCDTIRVYDGSWTDWGASDRPVETGA